MNGSSDVPQRASPATPKSTRAAKSSGPDSDSSASSKRTSTKTPTDRSPKVVERRSPRSPVTEQKKPSKMVDLETQLAQLQGDLKKTKDQLSSSESLKKQAQQEAEDVKQQLQAMAAKLEDSQNQLMEFSAAEEARLQELRKISQERDHVWQSEIETMQKQHSADLAALSSAMNEIHQLKLQLEMVTESEADQANQSERAEAELQFLKQEMARTLSAIDKLRLELSNREKAEAEAEAKVVETQQQLEVAKVTVETLRSEGSKLLELFRKSISELEESRAQVDSLEKTVQKLQDDQISVVGDSSRLGSLELEVEQLRCALQAAEIKYEEEQRRVAMQIRSAYDMADQMKAEFGARESELESALLKANAQREELKASLMDKENELQGIADMNEELKAKLENDQGQGQIQGQASKAGCESTADIAELKANLMDKENELQCISEENEQLKSEMAKQEAENIRSYESVIAEMELAKAKEKETLLKLDYITEEADKQSEKSARATEQLEAVRVLNLEMDSELRRLRVQSDQWRKAAEAAAAVLTTGNNGRLVERTSSLDVDYQSVAGKLMHSPFSDDLDDDSPKKKNGGMLRKFGLWKKK